jgi:hypothetical protein
MSETPVYDFPYPVPTDPDNVPLDMGELATKVEEVLEDNLATVTGQISAVDDKADDAQADATAAQSAAAAAQATANSALTAATAPRLGPAAAQVTDWNTDLASGWYYGLGATNSPSDATGADANLVGEVIRQSAGNAVQTVMTYGNAGAPVKMWTRKITGGTYGAWQTIVPQIGGGTSPAAEYTFSNTTTEPPSTGQIRFNNATQTAATKIWVHDQTAPGVDISVILAGIKSGTQFYLQDKDDASKWQLFSVTADAIDKTTYWEIPVTFIKGGTALSAQRVMATSIRAGGASGGSVDLDYNGSWAAGSYTDGDIVIYNGVAYMCVRPTSATPTAWPTPAILAYAERTTNLGLTTSRQDVLASPTTVYSGTPVIVEFFSPRVVGPANVNGTAVLELWDGSTEYGRIAEVGFGAWGSGNLSVAVPVLVRRRITPSAGSHTFKIVGLTTTSTGTVGAGAGGSAVLVPAYIRIEAVA